MDNKTRKLKLWITAVKAHTPISILKRTHVATESPAASANSEQPALRVKTVIEVGRWQEGNRNLGSLKRSSNPYRLNPKHRSEKSVIVKMLGPLHVAQFRFN